MATLRRGKGKLAILKPYRMEGGIGAFSILLHDAGNRLELSFTRAEWGHLVANAANIFARADANKLKEETTGMGDAFERHPSVDLPLMPTGPQKANQ
jgi:hypothetical protein